MHKTTRLKITGMTCSSCEVRIEHKWKELAGIEKVHVNHHSGKALITHSQELDLNQLQAMIEKDGYKVSFWNEENRETNGYQNDFTDYLQIGLIFVIFYTVYLILREMGWLPDSLGVTAGMSYWVVLGIGLVAAFSSCMAVTGGLLLAVSSRFNERHPEMTDWQKFKPQLYFNAGRLLGYGVLGGLVGALGSLIVISPRANAVILVIAGIAMLFLGFQLLHIFPSLRRLMPKMPKSLAHAIHGYEAHEHPAAPFFLGAGTFFLPCGFTQALQLYVLAQGDWKQGAITMLIFAVGTLPALLSVSAISSFVHGAIRHYFFRVAGVLVVLIAVFNLRSGLVLSGVNIDWKSWIRDSAASESNVEMVAGRQIAKMKVQGLNYIPYKFTVKKGIPVEWQIDGRGARGCSRSLFSAQLNLNEILPTNEVKTITFTPQKTGKIYFSCLMGMTTPGASFEVIE